VPLKRRDPQAALGNQRIDRAVYVAPATNPGSAPKRIHSVLKSRHSRVSTAPMFEKNIDSPDPKNSSYFGQRGHGISDCAKRQGRHHTVELTRGEGQMLPSLLHAFHGIARCRDPLCDLCSEHFLGVERD
jgi:hypothetical protein